MITPDAPFGRVLTAMVSPMTADGSIDLVGAATLAAHLVDAGNEGIVVNGTTGESPTTSDEEKDQLVRAVVDAVGDRARVVAGVGSYDTAHSCRLAAEAEKAGAHGLLVVTPYYNRPPQAGLVAHFERVADSTGLPVMLYDIPARTGTAIRTETLLRLSAHERIVAVKDAKDDLVASSRVLAETDLAYYSGTDALNLPILSIGGCGMVSVVSHVVTPALVEMTTSFLAGDVLRAREINAQLQPVYTGMFRTQGVIMVKAALRAMGLPAGPVRLPLVDATPEEIAQLRVDLGAAGVFSP
ncbi:MAG TPA: 4-hydroxy-tetrahydrodipicolinate synthase [Mycobacteriales bacterium]|nr:4-hydroxy-tetrahydrodipicolinate synthase [Mycobacteriales bacterium]